MVVIVMVVEGCCPWLLGSARLPRGSGWCMAWAGRPGAGQDAEGPPLERSGRRGGLLIAGEASHDSVRDRGPAGELGLEGRHRGDGLRRGADPQDVGFVLVIDGRVKDLYEEGRQVG